MYQQEGKEKGKAGKRKMAQTQACAQVAGRVVRGQGCLIVVR